MAAEVVVGRHVAEALLVTTQHAGAGSSAGLASAGLSSVWPSAVLFGVITTWLPLTSPSSTTGLPGRRPG